MITAKNNQKMKFLFYGLEILFCFFLQTSSGVMPEIFGAKPMLLAAVAITLALLEDEVPVLFFALEAGLLMDISFGKNFGLFAILLPILCCFISVFVRPYFSVTVKNAFIIDGLSIVVIILVDWLFRYCFAGYPNWVLILVDKHLAVFLYTILCLPIIYLINISVLFGLKTWNENL